MPKGLFGLPQVDPETRRQAIADPGLSWREWLFYDFLKTWIILGFLIVDSWVAATWIGPRLWIPLVASLVGASYLEVLAYRYLWYRPKETGKSVRSEFTPLWSRIPRSARPISVHDGPRGRNWFTPVPFGRWTPEADRVKRGLAPIDPASSGPDPSEFL